jgi:hypothetical protein
LASIISIGIATMLHTSSMVKGTFIARAITTEQLITHEGLGLRTRVESFRHILPASGARVSGTAL